MNESVVDRLFSEVDPEPGSFKFDAAVAEVFGDMLRRSIPGYAQLLGLIALVAKRHAQDGSQLYDLGASLGAATLAMRHAVGNRSVRLIAVDNSPAMVEKCRSIVSADSALAPVEVREEDLLASEIEDASVIVLNFTLQFVPRERRRELLKRLTNSLRPGGALVLAEKVAPEQGFESDYLRQLHDQFRIENGYSQLELSRKRLALEQVLVPETSGTLRGWLNDTGLKTSRLFSALQFEAFVGIKQ